MLFRSRLNAVPVGALGFAIITVPSRYLYFSIEHERKEKIVSAGQLGDQENTCQRRVHDRGHHSGHAEESKVFLWQIDFDEGKEVQRIGKDESAQCSHEQTGCEKSAAASARIGGYGSEHLRDDDKSEENEQHPMIEIGRASCRERV